ncbi:MAG: hypothetical protein ABL933_13755 [Methyloglobulus sp.]|nr:hypothetical protein [Methyloglobulus sp.]
MFLYNKKFVFYYFALLFWISFGGSAMAGETTLVSTQSNGYSGNGNSMFPIISADGRYVAFTSAASNLVWGDKNGASDVFVHDLQTKKTTLISVASDGTQGNRSSFAPSISTDGRFVIFTSNSWNLVPNDNNVHGDVFVHDRQTKVTSRVSVSSTGQQGDEWSIVGKYSISSDGRYLFFISYSTNFYADDTRVC